MTPIVLDLEWNQPLAGAMREPGLNGEIIQIGAAKIDLECNVLDTFNVTIKPKYYKWINKEISKLTGITNDDLASGIPFPEAATQFKDWCGDDFMFVSWGPEDYYMLGNNLWVYEMDTSWLPQTFDAQLMFDDMEKQEDRQFPLNYALWYYEEKPDGMHTALADVLSTVLVLKHLDIEEGLSDEYFRCDNYDEDVSNETETPNDEG